LFARGTFNVLPVEGNGGRVVWASPLQVGGEERFAALAPPIVSRFGILHFHDVLAQLSERFQIAVNGLDADSPPPGKVR
jgi:hypothetical protein